MKPYHSLPDYSATWFNELAAMVNEEPVRERDKVMMGTLKSIGIERGKKFEPDPKMQKLLDTAIVDARVIMQKFFETPGEAFSPWWPGSQWSAFSPNTMGLAYEFTYETAHGLWLDARAGGLFDWERYPAPKKLGGWQIDLMPGSTRHRRAIV